MKTIKKNWVRHNWEIQNRGGFSVGQTVIYKGKTLKIHSFPGELEKVTLKKYRKDGKLDGRDKGYYTTINKISSN